MELSPLDFGGLEPVHGLSLFNQDYETATSDDLTSAFQYAQTRARKVSEKLNRYEAYVHRGVRTALNELSQARERLQTGKRVLNQLQLHVMDSHRSADKSVESSGPSSVAARSPFVMSPQEVSASINRAHSHVDFLEQRVREMEIRFQAVAEFAAPLIFLSSEKRSRRKSQCENSATAFLHSHQDSRAHSNQTPFCALNSSASATTSIVCPAVTSSEPRAVFAEYFEWIQTPSLHDQQKQGLDCVATDSLPAASELHISPLPDVSTGARSIELEHTYDVSMSDAFFVPSTFQEQSQSAASVCSAMESKNSTAQTVPKVAECLPSLREENEWHNMLNYSELLEGCCLLQTALEDTKEKFDGLQARYMQKCKEIEQVKGSLHQTDVNKLRLLNILTRSKLQKAYDEIHRLEAARKKSEQKSSEMECLIKDAEKKVAKYKRFFFMDVFSSDDNSVYYFVQILFGSIFVLSSCWRRVFSWISGGRKFSSIDVASAIFMD